MFVWDTQHHTKALLVDFGTKLSRLLIIYSSVIPPSLSLLLSHFYSPLPFSVSFSSPCIWFKCAICYTFTGREADKAPEAVSEGVRHSEPADPRDQLENGGVTHKVALHCHCLTYHRQVESDWVRRGSWLGLSEARSGHSHIPDIIHTVSVIWHREGNEGIQEWKKV